MTGTKPTTTWTKESLRAAILAFGDELIRGQRINTNSAWLSQELAALGIAARSHVVVGDDLGDSIAALLSAAHHSDVIICTGGLGPTADDLAREAIAEAFERPLKLDPIALDQIRAVFQARGRDMPEQNRRQAFCPESGQLIPNPHGTAPGVELVVGDRGLVVIALPGVPDEMRDMWPDVRERLRTRFGTPTAIGHRTIKCFGIGESHLEARIAEFTRRDRHPLVGITVHDATISLRISAQDEDSDRCQKLLDETEQELRSRLEGLVFGTGDEELEDAVGRLLLARRLRLAVVEVAAPATISEWLRRSPNSASQFAGSVMVPDFGSLTSIWRELSSHANEPPRSLAMTLARKVGESFGADVGLAWGAIPVANSDSVWAGIITPHQSTAEQVPVSGHPAVRGPRAAKMSLDVLRKILGAEHGHHAPA